MKSSQIPWKYAFENEAGVIKISLQKKRKNNTSFTSSDNGKGFTETKDSAKMSLGIELINSMVSQLDGELEINREAGTHYTIYFSEKE